MADFCNKCTHDITNGEYSTSDFDGLCKPDEKSLVLCEGCGYIYVDHLGHKIENQD